MNATDVAHLTAHAAADLLRRRELSSLELTNAVLEQIERRDGEVHAYVHLAADLAREQAREADRRLAEGDAGPLCGIPYGLKDSISAAGLPLTCGSKILRGYVPPYDATATARLKDAGAVLLGMLNMDEFGMGSSTEFSSYGPTRNPRDVSRVPGGSSGGSAAAVAADEAIFALGEDTGGSVRTPAAFCGVVGLKPSYGRISRYGLVAYGSSLDQIGPLTKDVRDAALVLGAIAGHDPSDSTSLPWPVPDYTAHLEDGIKGVRLGVPTEYFGEGIDPAVASTVRAAIDRLAALGAEVGEVSMPHTRYALAAYYVIAPAEASANLARYDGVKYGISDRSGPDIWEMFARTREAGFGAEVKRRIMIGTYALSSGYYDAYYLKAQQVRTLVKQDFDRAFERFDALVGPTCPTVAFPIGDKTDDPVSMYLTDVLTVPINCAGVPALVVPCGESDGLPVGMQLIGPAGGEEALLRLGYAFEQSGGKR
ncbi:MAG TPA: Asp-tRNA(Asn)/Glu-tRNA(Gln) amidotransferase subunit GatA [Chloroflexota bacterium]|nr:Asp-tRNA(Asn)/Glu-tRNA(Gln) amidotransferase subunit GatA [Chloroflexota bacterium]